MFFRWLRIAVLYSSILLLAVPAAAGTIVVTVAGGLADAMASAEAGDVLELECGVYQEEGIQVVPGVTVRAAEAGCAILESTGAASVLVLDQAGADTRLEGLVFRLAYGATGWAAKGGALRLSAAAPVIVDCEFDGLRANYGGAVHCSAASDPAFENCRFLDNRAAAVGGAIACVGASSPVLTGCLLAGNWAEVSGAAIQAVAGSRPRLESCTVAKNACPAGAALSGWDLSDSVHERTIWSGQISACAWLGDSGSVPALSCSDLYGNLGGDWTGALAAQAGTAGNLSADPLFCASGRFTLDAASPCAAGGSACGRIGAFDVGCDGTVGAPGELPLVTALRDAYPNPCNPRTTIHFDLGCDGHVSVEVYDVAGRRIRRLVDEVMERGAHQVAWSGLDDKSRSVAAGVYFVRLAADETVAVKRVTLVK